VWIEPADKLMQLREREESPPQRQHRFDTLRYSIALGVRNEGRWSPGGTVKVPVTEVTWTYLANEHYWRRMHPAKQQAATFIAMPM
jgi:hypothetical protein